jgi:sulfate transport system ATP-binding protein
MSIEIRNLSKRFGAFTALTDVSLDIDHGELVALLGPSGCGKTTLLRIIAGLETPDSGSIAVHGEDATQLAVQRRRVGFVFQHYALFRHMTVFDNVAFGLRVKPRRERPGDEEIRARVHKLLNLVQLDWLGDRYPNQLSGGQRQRIALARALAVEPRVLLLDEPFGALDAKVRKELRRWLRRLHDELHVTSVFVTHDQEEALEVADRVVVMNRGRIEQVGPPDEVYTHPANSFVYGFLGTVNCFHGRAEAGIFTGEGLRVDVPDLPGTRAAEGAAIAFARPHELEVERYAPGADGVVADLVRKYLRGANVLLELERTDREAAVPIEVEVPRSQAERLELRLGERLVVRPRKLRVYSEPGLLPQTS